MARRALAAFGLACAFAGFPAVGSAPEAGPRWTVELHADARQALRVPVLRRPSLEAATALRVVVIVGSGCAGMGPLADRYFQGLSGAEVWVIHKPHTSVWVRPAPEACGEAFLRYDRPAAWQADALSALASLRKDSEAAPTWIVGISEGGEFVAPLAQALGAELQGIVLLAASGLDPSSSLRMQAERLGRMDAWTAIENATRGAQPDDQLLHGRSMGYWRDLMAWSVTRPLLEVDWTVLQVWGDRDELVPAAAYERFQDLARILPARVCTLHWAQSDHGLFAPVLGPAQPHVWQLISNWPRAPLNGCL